MQVPFQLTVRNMKRTESIESHIQEKISQLEKMCDRIISCQIVLELGSQNKHQGNLYNARIHVTLPKKDLVANHNCEENLWKAIKLAFDDMARQIEETMHRVKGDTKHHPDIIHGEIVRLYKQKEFGFIKSDGGDEYYFNADSVVHPNFIHLKEGLEVHFIEGLGDEGLQAHRVSAKEHI